MSGLPKGYKYQEDGPAVEFNIPPCYEATTFSRSVSNALNWLKKLLEPKAIMHEMGRTSVKLKKQWLIDYPHLATIGCDPDFDGYSSKRRDGIPESHQLIRGAGGHIHLGYPVSMIPPDILAQFCDLILALPMLKYDKQGARRGWWGRAGVYRPKEYGMEYRTLSSFWIWDANNSTMLALRALVMLQMMDASMEKWVALHNVVPWDSVKLIIAREDSKEADDLLNKLSTDYPMVKKLISGAF